MMGIQAESISPFPTGVLPPSTNGSERSSKMRRVDHAQSYSPLHIPQQPSPYLYHPAHQPLQHHSPHNQHLPQQLSELEQPQQLLQLQQSPALQSMQPLPLYPLSVPQHSLPQQANAQLVTELPLYEPPSQFAIPAPSHPHTAPSFLLNLHPSSSQDPTASQQMAQQFTQSYKLAPQHPQPLVNPNSPPLSSPLSYLLPPIDHTSPASTTGESLINPNNSLPSSLLSYLPPSINNTSSSSQPLSDPSSSPAPSYFPPSSTSPAPSLSPPLNPLHYGLRAELRRKSEQESLEGLVGLSDLAAEVGTRGKDRRREEGIGWQLQQMVQYIFDQTGQKMSMEVMMKARKGVDTRETGEVWENPQVSRVVEKANKSLEEALERADQREVELLQPKIELYDS